MHGDIAARREINISSLQKFEISCKVCKEKKDFLLIFFSQDSGTGWTVSRTRATRISSLELTVRMKIGTYEKN